MIWGLLVFSFLIAIAFGISFDAIGYSGTHYQVCGLCALAGVNMQPHPLALIMSFILATVAIIPERETIQGEVKK